MKLLPCVLLACVALVQVLPSASADEKRKSPAGTWGKKEGQAKIDFPEKEIMKIAPHGNDEVIVITCKYSVDKDGVIKAKVTGLEGKDEIKEKAKNIMPVGLEFSFKWTVDDHNATLDELKGENLDSFKSHLEGGYELKK